MTAIIKQSFVPVIEIHAFLANYIGANFSVDDVKAAALDGAEKGCYCTRLQATANESGKARSPITSCGTKALCDDGSCSEVSGIKAPADEAAVFTSEERVDMASKATGHNESDCKHWIETLCSTAAPAGP